MPLPVTALYAGLVGLWMLLLTVRVIGFRRGEKVSLGDGGSAMGLRLIRAHGNAAETVPIFLIMLALAEGLGWPGLALHALGLGFLAGRVLHGVHFQAHRKGGGLRIAGMALTLLTTAGLALGLVATVLLGEGA